jgi:iron complex outermembrane receptor protein
MRGQPQLLMGLWLAGVVVAAQPAWGSGNTALSEYGSTSTNPRRLLSQASTPQSPILIDRVRIDTTDKGIEVILETKQGEQLKVVNSSSGNSLIADITNAQLRLPSGNTFRQEKPVAGITEVTVVNQDSNTIRITVTGEAGTPTYELFDSDAGLILSVTPVSPSASQPETPQQPQDEKPTTETPTAQPTAETDTPIELVVTGEQDSYRVREATTGTKIEVPLRDVPASIQVIPKEVIQDRQVVRLNELADNVSGVRPQGTLGGLASQGYFIRGFATGFENLRDGFKDFGFTSPRDVAGVERVEFLKGPASVLYGSATSPGGVVNTITKKPLSEPFYQIGGTFGSYDFYRGTIDLTGPLTENRTALYRLNVAYENANSFRDFVENESTFINPVISLKVGENTDLTFAYEYQKYNYAFDRGFPSNNTVIFDLPISRSLDEPNLQDSEYR